MQEQLGDFFRAEYEKFFGPELCTEELCIDRTFLEKLHLLEDQWEECEVENFHGGVYSGARFSAANVRLEHVYEKRNGQEGLETYRKTVFRGLVIRCETAGEEQDAVSLSAPRLHALEQCANGKLVNQYQYQEGKILSLALETDYDFAAVPGNVDLRDIEAVRQSYAASLRKMEQLLEFLVE